MNLYIKGGVVTPFVFRFRHPEWLICAVLNEALDRLHPDQLSPEGIIVATNGAPSPELELGYDPPMPVVTLTSPHAPVARALHLAAGWLDGGVVDSVAVVTANILDVGWRRILAREGESLAYRVNLDRDDLESWAARSREYFARQAKKAVPSDWDVVLADPTGENCYVQDEALSLEFEESEEKDKALFDEEYSLLTRKTIAPSAYGGGCIIVSREPEDSFGEITSVDFGRGKGALAPLAALFALPQALEIVGEEPFTIIHPEPTATHPLAAVRLLQNEAFCTNYLGLEGEIIETSDSVNPDGGDMAYGWAPGPGEIRRIFAACTSTTPSLLLENDARGEGFCLTVRGRKS